MHSIENFVNEKVNAKSGISELLTTENEKFSNKDNPVCHDFLSKETVQQFITDINMNDMPSENYQSSLELESWTNDIETVFPNAESLSCKSDGTCSESSMQNFLHLSSDTEDSLIQNSNLCDIFDSEYNFDSIMCIDKPDLNRRNCSTPSTITQNLKFSDYSLEDKFNPLLALNSCNKLFLENNSEQCLVSSSNLSSSTKEYVNRATVVKLIAFKDNSSVEQKVEEKSYPQSSDLVLPQNSNATEVDEINCSLLHSKSHNVKRNIFPKTEASSNHLYSNNAENNESNNNNRCKIKKKISATTKCFLKKNSLSAKQFSSFSKNKKLNIAQKLKNKSIFYFKNYTCYPKPYRKRLVDLQNCSKTTRKFKRKRLKTYKAFSCRKVVKSVKACTEESILLRSNNINSKVLSETSSIDIKKEQRDVFKYFDINELYPDVSTDREMPVLLPLNRSNIDDNSNKEEQHPNSPPMPTLIPFTSENEHPFNVSHKSPSLHSSPNTMYNSEFDNNYSCCSFLSSTTQQSDLSPWSQSSDDDISTDKTTLWTQVRETDNVPTLVNNYPVYKISRKARKSFQKSTYCKETILNNINNNCSSSHHSESSLSQNKDLQPVVLLERICSAKETNTEDASTKEINTEDDSENKELLNSLRSEICDYFNSFVSSNSTSNDINDPEIDIIDGVEFLSFISKQNLEKFMKTNENVCFSNKYDTGIFERHKQNGAIIPTKTNDITRIKGWQNKLFVQEPCLPPPSYTSWEHLIGKDLDINDPSVKIAKQEITTTTHMENTNMLIPTVEKFTVDNVKIYSDINIVDYKDNKKGMIKAEMHDTTRKLIDKNCNKSAKSAFTSNLLDDFLKTRSKLNINLLAQCNPNILPIPQNSPILSVGSLKKSSRSVPSKRNSNLYRKGKNTVKKFDLKEHEIEIIENTNKSDSLSKKSKSERSYLNQDMREDSINNTLNTRQKTYVKIINKENACDSVKYCMVELHEADYTDYELNDENQNIYTIDVSELTEDERNVSVQSVETKLNDEEVLIRNTLWTHRHDSKGLKEFLRELNDGKYNTACYPKIIFGSPTVIDLKFAKKALVTLKRTSSSSDSDESTITTPTSSESTPKKSEKYRYKKCNSHLSSSVPHKHDLKQATRSKRLIRLPARYMDSAVSIPGNECWTASNETSKEKHNPNKQKSELEMGQSKQYLIQDRRIRKRKSTSENSQVEITNHNIVKNTHHILPHILQSNNKKFQNSETIKNSSYSKSSVCTPVIKQYISACATEVPSETSSDEPKPIKYKYYKKSLSLAKSISKSYSDYQENSVVKISDKRNQTEKHLKCNNNQFRLTNHPNVNKLPLDKFVRINLGKIPTSAEVMKAGICVNQIDGLKNSVTVNSEYMPENVNQKNKVEKSSNSGHQNVQILNVSVPNTQLQKKVESELGSNSLIVNVLVRNKIVPMMVVPVSSTKTSDKSEKTNCHQVSPSNATSSSKSPFILLPQSVCQSQSNDINSNSMTKSQQESKVPQSDTSTSTKTTFMNNLLKNDPVDNAFSIVQTTNQEQSFVSDNTKLLPSVTNSKILLSHKPKSDCLLENKHTSETSGSHSTQLKIVDHSSAFKVLNVEGKFVLTPTTSSQMQNFHTVTGSISSCNNETAIFSSSFTKSNNNFKLEESDKIITNETSLRTGKKLCAQNGINSEMLKVNFGKDFKSFRRRKQNKACNLLCCNSEDNAQPKNCNNFKKERTSPVVSEFPSSSRNVVHSWCFADQKNDDCNDSFDSDSNNRVTKESKKYLTDLLENLSLDLCLPDKNAHNGKCSTKLILHTARNHVCQLKRTFQLLDKEKKKLQDTQQTLLKKYCSLLKGMNVRKKNVLWRNMRVKLKNLIKSNASEEETVKACNDRRLSLQFTSERLASLRSYSNDVDIKVPNSEASCLKPKVDLNQLLAAAWKVCGPCVVKLVKLKNGQTVYVYTPLDSNSYNNLHTKERDNTSNNIKQNKSDTNHTREMCNNIISLAEINSLSECDVPVSEHWTVAASHSTEQNTIRNKEEENNYTTVWISDSGEPCFVTRLNMEDNIDCTEESYNACCNEKNKTSPAVISSSSVDKERFKKQVANRTERKKN